MALIPDIAVDASRDLTSTAFRLYVYYCRRRNRGTGGFRCPKAMVLNDLGLTESSYFRLKKELIKKRWIELESNDFIRPIMGFDTIKNDRFDDRKTLKNEGNTLKTGSQTIKNESAHKKESPANLPAKVTKGDAEIIFANWKAVLGHPKAIVDEKRLAKIKARLKEGFSVDDLCKVPYGVIQSPYHLGKNERQTRYDGIETIYRDAGQVEKFLDLASSREDHAAREVPEYCDACRANGGSILIVENGVTFSKRCLHIPRPRTMPRNSNHFNSKPCRST